MAAAKEKISALEKTIMPYRTQSHLLVYCGAATMRDPGYKEGQIDDFERRQIDVRCV